jgi:hypothetical protein
VRPRALLVAAVALLVMTAPAAAQLDRVSVHEGSDFENAQTLRNLTVTNDDEVRFGVSERYSDSFEDEPLDTGPAEGWDGPSNINVEVTDSFPSNDGSNTFYINSEDYQMKVDGQPWNASTGNVSTWVRVSNQPVFSGLNLTEGGSSVIRVGIDGDELVYYDSGTEQTLETGISEAEFKIYDIDPSADTFDLRYKVDGGAWQTAADLGSDSPMTNGWQSSYITSGGAGKAWFDSFSAEGSFSRGVYLSEVHEITNPDTTFINVTHVEGGRLRVFAECVAPDGSTSGCGFISETTTTGNHSFSIPDQDTNRVQLRIIFNRWDENPEIRFDVEGMSAPSRDPVVDNSSASPDGATVGSTPTLEVNVSDPDFATEGGDSVTVDFELNGLVVGSDTLTSNGTASYSPSSVQGGENTWNVTATDDFQRSADGGVFNFTSPGTLEVRNETNTSQLVDGVETQAEFYFDRDNQPDLIESRNSTTGVIDMSGLPADEEFVVVAGAEGYYNRRIWVPSLFETGTVFLLNDSENAVQPTFTLTDFTGEYPRNATVLEIQRALNTSTGSEWQTVEGDYFGGANQVTAQLKFNERHRLVITNTRTNESRILGPYTATSSNIVELEVFTDDEVIAEQEGPHALFTPTVSTLAAKQTGMSAEVFNGSESLDGYTVRAALENGTTLHSSSYTGQGGLHTFTADLSGAGGQEVTVWVNWTAGASSGSINETWYVSPGRSNQYSLLSLVAGVDLGGSTPNALSVLLTLTLAVFGTAYAATNTGSGVAGLAGLGVIVAAGIIDWVPLVWVVPVGLTWVILSAVRNRI